MYSRMSLAAWGTATGGIIYANNGAIYSNRRGRTATERRKAVFKAQLKAIRLREPGETREKCTLALGHALSLSQILEKMPKGFSKLRRLRESARTSRMVNPQRPNRKPWD